MKDKRKSKISLEQFRPKVDEKGRLIIPSIPYPSGYTVHKTSFNENGCLTKLELFAYFEESMVDIVAEEAESLQVAKAGTYPLYFDAQRTPKNSNHEILYFNIVHWKKSIVLIKAYRNSDDGRFKLEVTRGKKGKVGKKFLEPIPTLNSLGALLKKLTRNVDPVNDKSHSSDIFRISEFIDGCREVFRENRLKGQLRLLDSQKLRKDIKFWF